VARVELENLSKSFGSLQVLSDINLTVADGEFLTLVGPSGCGKSTLIRIIAGLEPQSGGSVSIGGERIDHLRPHERRVAMVFQSYALYPHMSVFSNIALPLTMSRLHLYERLPLIRLLSLRRRAAMREISHEVYTIAEQLQIGALLDRRPAKLSGGQRQRVALGRAMVRHPAVFLMDEPLSNLDAKLRVHMRSELADLHRRVDGTFIYVTHDQVEAMTMSDRVAMMDAGRILQLGTPDELYGRPANLQVAQFIGSPAINLLPARVAKNGVVEFFSQSLPMRTEFTEGTSLTIGVRPEALRPLTGGGSDSISFPARLKRSEHLGSEKILHFEVPALSDTVVVCRVAASIADSDVETTDLTFDPSTCHLFDADGKRVVAADAAVGGSAGGPIRFPIGGSAR
jgi:multiple sugar transport system ATP-binding protein